MLVVPMFHANAWGAPYAAAMVGSKLVLPGPFLDGQSVYELMRDERVTFSMGVPTVWMMLFGYLDEHPEIDPRALALASVGIGGSAMSCAMLERFENDFGVEVLQGWGMTETSPDRRHRQAAAQTRRICGRRPNQGQAEAGSRRLGC
jgi:fatty-acyl-CoA synthase